MKTVTGLRYCTLAVAMALSVTAARAADECGLATGTPATATCTVAGNPYPNGIAYQIDNGDLVVNLDPGVVIDTTVVGAVAGVNAQSNVSGSIFVNAAAATIVLDNDPAAIFRIGIRAAAAAGDVFVDTGAGITVAAQIAQGIAAQSQGNLASVTYDGPGINVFGQDSAGIYTGNFGPGNALVDAAGEITVLDASDAGAITSGIFAWTVGGGDTSVRYRDGTVSVTGPAPYGISSVAYLGGSAEIVTDPGTVVTVSGFSTPGASPNAISAATFGGTAANGDFVRVDVASRIMSSGPDTPGPLQTFNANGIDAESDLDAPITVNYTGPGITITGGGGIGILALSGSGAIDVTSSGPIETSGVVSHGIFADSGDTLSPVAPVLQGLPTGPVHGIPFAGAGVGGAVNVTSFDSITTVGSESLGIWANSASGPVTVTAGDVSSSGAFAVAIRATGGGLAIVNVSEGAVVSGGYQTDPAAVGATFFLPSAGVVLGSLSPDTAVLNNAGTIGAWSDRAVIEAELVLDGFGAEVLTINNEGTITGFITLGSGDATFNNLSPNSLDLRDFEDTDADGIRDTERVAVSDFGAGLDVFNNEANGVVRLLTVADPVTVDTTAQFLPGGFSVHDIALPGVEQGQLINLEVFENRGLITLADLETGGGSSVAGDVLVITGGALPGTNGGGLYLSDGGALHLDVGLNEGDAASLADILVLDTTAVGPGGATGIGVTNAGGLGELTLGDGIKVVDVLDPSSSATDAFVLDGRAAAGPFEYFLFQGGVADPADGDWYLRSDGILRPEIPAYLGNTRGALGMVVHTLHDRLGEPQFASDARPADANDSLDTAWLRVVGRYQSVEPSGFDSDTHTWLVQGGVEMADWSLSEGSNDRLHLGGMFTYGSADTDATAFLNPNRAEGEVDGYILGGYATWYQNDAARLGLYVDGWVQGGLFDSAVKADFMPTQDYDAYSIAGSVEAGYALALVADGGAVIEPQAQLVLLQYWQDDFLDATGTLISDGDQAAAISRLGVRAYDTFVHEGSKYQPYLAFNWWHDFEDEKIALNGIGFDGGVPSDRYEAGAGLNVAIDRGVTLWANAEYQWGADGYESVEGLVGVKAAW